MEHLAILRRGDPEEIRLALKVAQAENLIGSSPCGAVGLPSGASRTIDEWAESRALVECRRFDLAAYQDMRGFVKSVYARLAK